MFREVSFSICNQTELGLDSLSLILVSINLQSNSVNLQRDGDLKCKCNYIELIIILWIRLNTDSKL